MKHSHHLRGGAAAALGTALFIGVNLAAATQAAAPTYERFLAGIKLNSTGKTVLAKYGNPNEVVIGDVGARQGANGAPGQGGNPGAPDEQGAFPGGGPGPSPDGGLPPLGFGGGVKGGGSSAFPGAGGVGFPRTPGGFPGAPGGGFPGGGPADEGAAPGAGGFGGGTVGPFGNTQSTVAREQEVTWIYNRKVNDKKGASQLVSYEFLIGPSGQVEQIRVSGYTGGNVRTGRGIGLGSTYREVIATYGYPEEHAAYGSVLVASYKNRAHISFQFLNDRVSGNVINPGNKVIGITIATVE